MDLHLQRMARFTCLVVSGQKVMWTLVRRCRKHFNLIVYAINMHFSLWFGLIYAVQ